MTTKIYLDHNASTPLAPPVVKHIQQTVAQMHGNPSSLHWAGKPAARMIQKARDEVAQLLGAHSDEIVFMSGGSEANNHAIKGVFFSSLAKGERPHFVTSAIEHPATLAPLAFATTLGAELSVVPVDATGRVDAHDVEKALRSNTVLVSLMHANNEVGTLQPVEEVAALCRERGILCHSDAAQSVGKIELNVRDLGIDLLSLAGHKLGAPKGVGALYVRRGTRLEPLVHGAAHESGRRAGTENVLLVSALGVAATLAREAPVHERMLQLRERLHQGLIQHHRLSLNGHPRWRLPNTLNVSFLDRFGDEILAALPEIAASTGSACHAGERSISPVLKAMGKSPEQAQGAIRLSLGRETTEADVDGAIALFKRVSDEPTSSAASNAPN